MKQKIDPKYFQKEKSEKIAVCVRMRPETKDKSQKKAKQLKVSYSRYVEMILVNAHS